VPQPASPAHAGRQPPEAQAPICVTATALPSLPQARPSHPSPGSGHQKLRSSCCCIQVSGGRPWRIPASTPPLRVRLAALKPTFLWNGRPEFLAHGPHCSTLVAPGGRRRKERFECTWKLWILQWELWFLTVVGDCATTIFTTLHCLLIGQN